MSREDHATLNALAETDFDAACEYERHLEREAESDKRNGRVEQDIEQALEGRGAGAYSTGGGHKRTTQPGCE